MQCSIAPSTRTHSRSAARLQLEHPAEGDPQPGGHAAGGARLPAAAAAAASGRTAPHPQDAPHPAPFSTSKLRQRQDSNLVVEQSSSSTEGGSMDEESGPEELRAGPSHSSFSFAPSQDQPGGDEQAASAPEDAQQVRGGGGPTPAHAAHRGQPHAAVPRARFGGLLT